MEKGVSAVIATILMLIITIALAGMAYMYIAGVFTGVTQGIEVSDIWCEEQAGEWGNDTIVLIIKNIGTTSIASFDCIQTAPSTPDYDISTAAPRTNICNTTLMGLSGFTIEPGMTRTFRDTCYGTGSSRACSYRLTPPVGKTITASWVCT